jgi:hypothetical protein
MWWTLGFSDRRSQHIAGGSSVQPVSHTAEVLSCDTSVLHVNGAFLRTSNCKHTNAIKTHFSKGPT